MAPTSGRRRLAACLAERSSGVALQESFFVAEAERDELGDVVELRFRFLNTAAQKLYGHSPDDILGRGLRELYPSVTDLGIFACYVQPLHTGRPSAMRVPAFDENGVRGAFDVEARPYPFGDGVVVTAVDVTEEVGAQLELQDSKSLMQVVLDHTSDAIMRFGPDLRVEYVNRQLVQFTGISFEDWLGKTFHEAGFPPHLTEGWDEYSRRVFATGQPVLHDFELDLPAGHRWFETRVDPEFGPDGSVAHVITTSRDVTDRHRAEDELRRSEDFLSVVLNSSLDGTTTFAPDLRIEYVNRRVVELSGMSAESWIGRTLDELGYAPSEVDFWSSRIRQVLATGQPTVMEYEVENSEGNRWYEASLAPQLDADGSVLRVISTNRDVTARVLAERTLSEVAMHDSLTGLANRTALLEDIGRALSAGRRKGRSTAVLMIDLDRFKIVNDSLGHDVGDDLLRAAAERLAGTIRGGDLVGRTGGDEFLVVMRDLDEPAEPLGAAWRIVEAFRQPFGIGDVELFSTASIGVAIASESSAPADLIREADTAMYVAKEGGRDRVSVFNEELRHAVAARLAIEGDLRHAVSRSQLAVWFQPEVSLATGSVIAVEALLRWHHPSGETLDASRFVDVAEETGLIVDIGDWVLREACNQAAAWNNARPAHPLTVRVNVSTLQLAQDGLLPSLDGALAASGLKPGLLCLEITETALLHESALTRDNLSGINDRGVRIAIDDFGTGYASLTYLHRYPIDVLKIDRSFVSGISANAFDHRLVGALVALAEHLELSVTAEGVETEDQARLLRALGCPGAQGYLYSAAVPPEAMQAMIDTVFPHA